MNLRQRTIAAMHWTSASAALRGALQLVQLTILARALTPIEFGNAAAVIAIILFVSVLSDLGINGAYLHARNVERQQRSALYWLNVLTGASLTLIVILLTPIIDWGAPNQQIKELLISYSPIYLISAIGLQLRFDAEKRLQFSRVAVIEVSATFLGVCLTSTLASMGYGAAAVIYGALAAATTNTCLNWFLLSDGWRPNMVPHIAEARKFIRYGLASVGNGILGNFSTSLDLLIGIRIIGASEFGLYSAPRNLFNQILALVNPIITRVGFPLVAHMESDRERIARLYQRMLQAIVGVNAPVYLFAAFFSEPIVHILFGERWTAMRSAFVVLALWGLGRSIMNPVGSLLFGTGRPGLALKWNLYQTVIALLALQFVVGRTAFDLGSMMLALIAAQILPAWFFLIKISCHLTLGAYVKAIMQPLTCAFVAIAAAAFIVQELDNYLVQVMLGAMITGMLYTVISWRLHEDWFVLASEQIHRVISR